VGSGPSARGLIKQGVKDDGANEFINREWRVGTIEQEPYDTGLKNAFRQFFRVNLISMRPRPPLDAERLESGGNGLGRYVGLLRLCICFLWRS
jgi:hypothetical protein